MVPGDVRVETAERGRVDEGVAGEDDVRPGAEAEIQSAVVLAVGDVAEGQFQTLRAGDGLQRDIAEVLREGVEGYGCLLLFVAEEAEGNVANRRARTQWLCRVVRAVVERGRAAMQEDALLPVVGLARERESAGTVLAQGAVGTVVVHVARVDDLAGAAEERRALVEAEGGLAGERHGMLQVVVDEVGVIVALGVVGDGGRAGETVEVPYASAIAVEPPRAVAEGGRGHRMRDDVSA